jgi:hypothetical protein
VCLLDDAGTRLGKARVPDGIEGLARIHELVVGCVAAASSGRGDQPRLPGRSDATTCTPLLASEHPRALLDHRVGPHHRWRGRQLFVAPGRWSPMAPRRYACCASTRTSVECPWPPLLTRLSRALLEPRVATLGPALGCQHQPQPSFRNPRCRRDRCRPL